MKTINLIIWLLVIITIEFILVGLTMRSISDNNCEELCKDKGALAHKVFYSGDFKLNDVCECIFSDKIKAWRMG